MIAGRESEGREEGMKRNIVGVKKLGRNEGRKGERKGKTEGKHESSTE